MKALKQIVSTLLLGASIFAASAASAAPIVYFGENQSPAGTVSGDPVLARASFLSSLIGVSNEDFEAQSGGAPLNLNFTGSGGAITATLSGSGSVGVGPGAGRFNTSAGGSRYWEVSGAFVITFSEAISAFGFYGTDIGDFDGQVTLGLAGGGSVDLTVDNTINGNNGSLLFFGFIDPTQSYTSITFGNTAAGSDFFGFDDMVIGDREQVVIPVPEPGSAALLAMALLGMGAATRRKLRK